MAEDRDEDRAAQSEPGTREAGLRAARAAVEAHRARAEQQPDALPELARALIDLGARASALGERSEALQATQAAVDIYRGLTAEAPDAFLSLLAAALDDLCARSTELGRRHEALQIAQEAVELHRALVKQAPDTTHHQGLANALWALGLAHLDVGAPPSALEALVEGARMILDDNKDNKKGPARG